MSLRHTGAVAVAALLLAASSASAQNLIVNGGFESGALGPWTSYLTDADRYDLILPDGSAGSCRSPWHIAVGSGSCSHMITTTGSGAYSAGSTFDVNEGTIRYLAQSFVVPTEVRSATLTFSDARTSQVGSSDASKTFWVGFLTADGDPASIFALGGGDGSVYKQTYYGSFTQDWTVHSLDVSTIMDFYAGQTLTLIFGTAISESAGPGDQAIDDVSLTYDTPEPATFGLMLAGLIGIGGVARRRSRRA